MSVLVSYSLHQSDSAKEKSDLNDSNVAWLYYQSNASFSLA